MIKFIKYDLKSNKNYLMTILLIQLIALVGSFLVRMFVPMNVLFAEKRLTDIIFITSIVFFVGINFVFMANFIYKDYFTKRAMLTFSLPMSIKSFVLGKVIGISLFFITSGIFLSLSLLLLGYTLGSDFLYYMIFAFILINLLSLCLNLNMARSRFTGKVSWLAMVMTLVVLIAPIFIYTSFNALVLIDGDLVRTSGMGFSFIFPFAVGEGILYKILTPLIYYLVAVFILYFVNVSYISKNLDLS